MDLCFFSSQSDCMYFVSWTHVSSCAWDSRTCRRIFAAGRLLVIQWICAVSFFSSTSAKVSGRGCFDNVSTTVISLPGTYVISKSYLIILIFISWIPGSLWSYFNCYANSDDVVFELLTSPGSRWCLLLDLSIAHFCWCQWPWCISHCSFGFVWRRTVPGPYDVRHLPTRWSSCRGRKVLWPLMMIALYLIWLNAFCWWSHLVHSVFEPRRTCNGCSTVAICGMNILR